MTLEDRIRRAVDIAHERHMPVVWTVRDKVIDGPAVAGKLPDNPNTGAGSEPGVMTLEVRRPDGTTAVLPEQLFHGKDIGEILAVIEYWAARS